MKTLFKTFTAAFLVAVLFTGCSKKESATPKSSSTWTVMGTKYTGTFTGFTNSELLSFAQNITNQPEIGIQFKSTPAASGTYSVVSLYSGAVGDSQCYIITTNSTGTPLLNSAAGGSVTVTVSGSKITASFTNISMEEYLGTEDPVTGEPQFQAEGTTSGSLSSQ